MKSRISKTGHLAPLFRKIGKQIGASVLVEPSWGRVGQITFRNGHRSYFRASMLDVNPMGSSEIAKDKDFAAFFMKKMGYPTVPGKTFFSKPWRKKIGASGRDIHAAYRYARSLGFPVVVKPNGGSQGTNVEFVYGKTDFYRAMRSAFESDKIALVQPIAHGKDYRIVVLEDEVISAYERIPLSVVGDGKWTVLQLFRRKRKEYKAANRDFKIDEDDPRILAKLRRARMTLQSVPRAGQVVYLLNNANLSTGGDSVDVTKGIHPYFRNKSIKLTRDMGLRLCGVDLVIENGIHQPGPYRVLEINSAPGLDHYAKLGKAQEKTVEGLYRKVLKRMEAW
jgi:D-alanine-D-alanine ligase-like ATP-grasp enzyme